MPFRTLCFAQRQEAHFKVPLAPKRFIGARAFVGPVSVSAIVPVDMLGTWEHEGHRKRRFEGPFTDECEC